jgi:hypothetical protein
MLSSTGALGAAWFIRCLSEWGRVILFISRNARFTGVIFICVTMFRFFLLAKVFRCYFLFSTLLLFRAHAIAIFT